MLICYPYTASKQPTPSAQSPSDSESDEDAYSGSRHRTLTTKKSQQRRILQSATEPVNTHGEVRFSTRKAAKVSNYNEDDEDPFDDEENILTPGYWVTAPEEDTPAIDVVLNHRLREDRSKLYIVAESKAKTYSSIDTEITTPGKEDFEYKVSANLILRQPQRPWVLFANHRHVQIKWQGKAHIHATWETSGALASYRGIRRLDNYYRKIVEEDIHMTHDSGIPPEEKEKWSLDRERDADALDDYVKVERVIGKQIDEDGEVEYFVKCKLLFSLF